MDTLRLVHILCERTDYRANWLTNVTACELINAGGRCREQFVSFNFSRTKASIGRRTLASSVVC